MNSPEPSHETFPEAVENIGHDPAKFLDRPLFGGSAETSAPGLIIQDRIRGIDRLAVLAVYETVERRLADRLEREPREKVLELIADRREELLENGERPDLPLWSAEERRERALEQFRRVDGRKSTQREADDAPLSASAKLSRMRADGGSSE